MSLVADIFDVLIQTDTGDMIASTTLSSADVKIAVDEKEITAGKGDALVAILHSARKVDISLAEVTFKWDWIANQLGQTETTGMAVAYAMPKFYTCVDSTGSIVINLDQAPKFTAAQTQDIKIFTSAGVPVDNSEIAILAKKVTLTSGAVAGDIMEVRGYSYETPATASTILIDNKSFADGAKVILSTLEIDEDESVLAEIQIQLDECLPSGNFEINTKSQRDASVSNFSFRAIKPRTSDNLGRMIRIPKA